MCIRDSYCVVAFCFSMTVHGHDKTVACKILMRNFKSSTYSPRHIATDRHLVYKLKEYLKGKRFESDEDLQETVTIFLNELVVKVYDAEVQKLLKRYDWCFSLQGEHVEK